MQKKILIILYMAIICIGTTKSFAQTENTEGGFGFTVDELFYEVIIFDQNEVSVLGRTFTSQLDDYFIVIKHRNYLGIMLANAKQLSPVITIIDFADANNSIAFGSNVQTDVGIPSNTLGVWAGNVTEIISCNTKEPIVMRQQFSH